MKQNPQYEIKTNPLNEYIVERPKSDKSKAVAALLCFFLGTLGAHKFYLKNNMSGALMFLLMLVGCVTSYFFIGYFVIAFVEIWSLVDFVTILLGRMRDGKGKKVK